MSEEFGGKVRAELVDAEEVLVPHSIGVGIMHRDTEVGPILGVHIVGRLNFQPYSVMVAFDQERCVGLIVQVRDMLLEAGTPPGQIIKLMKDAYGRLEAFKDLDRASRQPHEEPNMNFVCKACQDGEHCNRGKDDTWCDCQHRSHVNPDQPSSPVVPVNGDD